MALDKPTRFATDLFESAAVEGARQRRSAEQQLDHWARLGRAVSMHQTAARLRVEAVLAGIWARVLKREQVRVSRLPSRLKAREHLVLGKAESEQRPLPRPPAAPAGRVARQV